MGVEGVVLSTDRQTYGPGDGVQLTLRNEAGEALGMNLCLSELERREAGQWERSPVQSDEICVSILQVLEPGESASESVELPAGLPPGDYRFSTNLEGMERGELGLHPSNSFQVRNQP